MHLYGSGAILYFSGSGGVPFQPHAAEPSRYAPAMRSLLGDTLHSEIWQRLLSLETRDAVSAWHKTILSRELSARRIKEITSSAKQAREFFRNAEGAHNSVKPVLSFYGVASLSRATLLLLKRGSGEASLTRGHGLETMGWANTLSGDIPAGLAALETLRIRSCAGLFSEFVKETNNCMCMHVNSSQVDWRINYDIPPIGEEFTFGDLMSRIPDLLNEHKRTLGAANYASINTMTYTEEDGFFAKVSAGQFASFQDSYSALGFSLAHLNDWCDVRASKEIFSAQTPQYMHTYVNKTFGTIPSLHIVKPFDNGSRYSQLAITYLLSYCLGMLARYFPTQWVSLFSGDKGDGLWPAINSAQKYIDASFPELAVELIHYTLDQTESSGA